MNTNDTRSFEQMTDVELLRQFTTPISGEDTEGTISELRTLLNDATGAIIFSLVFKDDEHEKEFIKAETRLTAWGIVPEPLYLFFASKIKEEVHAFLLENNMPEFKEEDMAWTKLEQESGQPHYENMEDIFAGVRKRLSNAFGVIMFSFAVQSSGDTINDINHAKSLITSVGHVPVPAYEVFITEAEKAVRRLLTDVDPSVDPDVDPDAVADATLRG
jgi:hypothetical protein